MEPGVREMILASSFNGSGHPTKLVQQVMCNYWCSLDLPRFHVRVNPLDWRRPTHLWSRAHFHKSHDLLSDLSIEVKGKQMYLLPLEQESKSKLLYNTHTHTHTHTQDEMAGGSKKALYNVIKCDLWNRSGKH